jgi:hypothetical protein
VHGLTAFFSNYGDTPQSAAPTVGTSDEKARLSAPVEDSEKEVAEDKPAAAMPTPTPVPHVAESEAEPVPVPITPGSGLVKKVRSLHMGGHASGSSIILCGPTPTRPQTSSYASVCVEHDAAVAQRACHERAAARLLGRAGVTTSSPVPTVTDQDGVELGEEDGCLEKESMGHGCRQEGLVAGPPIENITSCSDRRHWLSTYIPNTYIYAVAMVSCSWSMARKSVQPWRASKITFAFGRSPTYLTAKFTTCSEANRA